MDFGDSDDDFFNSVDLDAVCAQAEQAHTISKSSSSSHAGKESSEDTACETCGFFGEGSQCHNCGSAFSKTVPSPSSSSSNLIDLSHAPPQTTDSVQNKPQHRTPWNNHDNDNPPKGKDVQTMPKRMLHSMGPKTTTITPWSRAAGSSSSSSSRGYEKVQVLLPTRESSSKVSHNASTIDTWMFPKSEDYPMREYQKNIVRTALFKNTLVVLPTGLGKTFIAAVVIFNYLRWFPQGKVIFMAPTRPLVTQQVKACHGIVGIDTSIIARLMGNVKPEEREAMWRERRLIFTTPQTAQKDCESGILPCDQVVLVVIDEAHRATGKYSFVKVVEEIRQKTFNFRTLALSATPGKDKQSVQRVVDNLLIAAIEHRKEDDPDVKKYVFNKSLHIENIKLTPLCQGLVKDLNSAAREQLEEIRKIPNVPSLLRKRETELSHTIVAQSLGRPPPFGGGGDQQSYFRMQAKVAVLQFILHARHQLICSGLGAMIKFLENNQEGRCTKSKKQFFETPVYKRILSRAKALVQDPSSNPKILKLQEILCDHFERYNNAGKKTSCIVFSQFRNSVAEICEQLQRKTNLRVSPFVGQSSAAKGKRKQNTASKSRKRKSSNEDDGDMDDCENEDPMEEEESVATKGQDQKLQQEIVRKFRNGELDVLVATSIGEEGLDIGSVDIIVCFDVLKSPIRMVQRFGRAGRKRCGTVHVLCSEGKEYDDFVHGLKQSNVISNLLRSNKIKFSSNSPRMLPSGVHPQMVYEAFEMAEYRSSQIAGSSPPRVKKRNGSTEKSSSSSSAKEMVPLTDAQWKYYHERLCPPNRLSASELWETLPSQTKIFSTGKFLSAKSLSLKTFRYYVAGKAWEQDLKLLPERKDVLSQDSDDSDLDLAFEKKSPASRVDEDALFDEVSFRPDHVGSLSSSKPPTIATQDVNRTKRKNSHGDNEDRHQSVLSLLSSDEEEDDFAEKPARVNKTPVRPSTPAIQPTTSSSSARTRSKPEKENVITKTPVQASSSTPSSSSKPKETPLQPRFAVGDIVEVEPRLGPNMNKLGGTAIITHVWEGSTYDVRYTVNQGTERGLSETLLKKGIDPNSERPVRSTRTLNPKTVESPTPSSSSATYSSAHKQRDDSSSDSESDFEQRPPSSKKKKNATVTKLSKPAQHHKEATPEKRTGIEPPKQNDTTKKETPKIVPFPEGAERNDAERNDAERNDAEKNDAERNDAERNDAVRNDTVRNDTERNVAVRNDAVRNDAVRNVAVRNEQETHTEALEILEEVNNDMDSDAESLFAELIPLPPGMKPTSQCCRSLTATKYCSRCGGKNINDNGGLVTCAERGCGASIHAECYGIKEEERHRWRCPPCASGVRPIEMHMRTCLLCPRRDGVLHPIKLTWAHVACLFNNPDIDAELNTEVDLEKPIQSGLLQLHARTCSLCQDFVGVCVPCAHPGCLLAVHGSCAVMQECRVQNIGLCCKTHATMYKSHVETDDMEQKELAGNKEAPRNENQAKAQIISPPPSGLIAKPPTIPSFESLLEQVSPITPRTSSSSSSGKRKRENEETPGSGLVSPISETESIILPKHRRLAKASPVLVSSQTSEDGIILPPKYKKHNSNNAAPMDSESSSEDEQDRQDVNKVKKLKRGGKRVRACETSSQVELTRKTTKPNKQKKDTETRSRFMEDEASVSGEDSGDEDEEDLLGEDDDVNVSGLIDDSSQLSEQSSVVMPNPMLKTPPLRRGKHMNRVLERLENLARYEEACRQNGEVLSMEEEEEEEEEENQNEIHLESAEESDGDFCATGKTKLVGKKANKEEHVDLPATTVVSNTTEKASPSILLGSNYNMGNESVLIWGDAKKQGTLVNDVSRILRSSTCAKVHMQRRFDLQGADFVLSSRVCAIIFSQATLLKRWRHHKMLAEGYGDPNQRQALSELLSLLCVKYCRPVVIIQHVPEDGEDLQLHPQHMFAKDFFEAQMHLLEYPNVTTLLTSSTKHTASMLVDIARKEREEQYDLVSLGLEKKDGNSFGEHTSRVLEFFLSNPGISLVTARRLVQLHEGKSLQDFFSGLRGASAIRQAVPGLEVKTTGMIWAFFCKAWSGQKHS